MSLAKPTSSTLRVVLLIAAAQALAIGLYLYVESGRGEGLQETTSYERLPPHPAPALELLTSDGSRKSLASLRGRPVLLHFWATWCPPCKKELPGLLEVGRELERTGRAQLVALSMDDGWPAVRVFLRDSVPPSVFRTPAREAAAAFDVAVLPDTYLLNADGTLGTRFGGARDWSSPAMRAALNAALGEVPSGAPSR